MLWPFPAIFCHMYVNFSQNWGSNDHFEVPNLPKFLLVLALWHKMQIFSFLFILWFCTKSNISGFYIFVFCLITFVTKQNRLVKHLKMTVWISVFRKINLQLAKNGQVCSLHGHISTFWTNQDIDLFSISKWMSESQVFCHTYDKKWQEMVLDQSFISIFHFRSVYRYINK